MTSCCPRAACRWAAMTWCTARGSISARAGRAWAIGLSGTPVACLAAFQLIVRPVLRRLAGAHLVVRPVELRTLADAWPRPTDRLRALWGCVNAGGEGMVHFLTDGAAGRL